MTLLQPASLGEAQELFKKLKAEWELWVYSKGWRLRAGEGRILPRGAKGTGRQAWDLINNRKVMVEDRVHKLDGNHPKGLAEDEQLFVDGKHITESTAPEWIEAGEKWESMHPLCSWGGRFSDGNHISLHWEGKK